MMEGKRRGNEIKKMWVRDRGREQKGERQKSRKEKRKTGTGRWQGGLEVSAETFRETFFQLLSVTGRSSHVELSLFQAWAPLSEFTD